MSRFIIGKCRSGKTITSDPSQDGLESFEEIFDALPMLSAVTMREYRKHGESDLYDGLENQITNLEIDLKRSKQFFLQMRLIGAATSVETTAYGRTLLAPEFSD